MQRKRDDHAPAPVAHAARRVRCFAAGQARRGDDVEFLNSQHLRTEALLQFVGLAWHRHEGAARLLTGNNGGGVFKRMGGFDEVGGQDLVFAHGRFFDLNIEDCVALCRDLRLLFCVIV